MVVTGEEGGVTRTRLVGCVRLRCRAGHGRRLWIRMGKMKRTLGRNGGRTCLSNELLEGWVRKEEEWCCALRAMAIGETSLERPLESMGERWGRDWEEVGRRSEKGTGRTLMGLYVHRMRVVGDGKVTER